MCGGGVEFITLARGDRDFRAEFAQHLGHLQTEATRTARDQRHTSRQILQLGQTHCDLHSR